GHRFLVTVYIEQPAGQRDVHGQYIPRQVSERTPISYGAHATHPRRQPAEPREDGGVRQDTDSS
ncbi:MAG: hypothetical protein K2L27_01170, partial [Muribaculaceae bacterium]|nr:hypothetical protein [Muribaculaceae bacterium]